MSLFLSRTERPVVYVIEASTDGQPLGVKVGFSRNVDKRLKRLQYLHTLDLRLVAAFPSPFADFAEKRAHKILFAKHGGHYEWFRVTPEVAFAAITEALAQVEPKK